MKSCRSSAAKRSITGNRCRFFRNAGASDWPMAISFLHPEHVKNEQNPSCLQCSTYSNGQSSAGLMGHLHMATGQQQSACSCRAMERFPLQIKLGANLLSTMSFSMWSQNSGVSQSGTSGKMRAVVLFVSMMTCLQGYQSTILPCDCHMLLSATFTIDIWAALLWQAGH